MKLKRVSKVYTGPKFNILYWADSCCTHTGFGVVSKYLLHELHQSGRYNITQLAINHYDLLYDEKKYPYRIVPARIGNPQDPYGRALLFSLLQTHPYDMLFIMNDVPVVQDITAKLYEYQIKRLQAGKPLSLVYYYPIDSHLPFGWTDMIKMADRSVCYTQFGARETEKFGVKPSQVIYVGTDTVLFHPLTAEEKQEARKRYFELSDPTTFIWINVNRNSLRKNVAQTIRAFARFKKEVCNNSILYLHMAMVDGGGAGGIDVDLRVPAKEMGLVLGRDIRFPQNFHPAHGCSDQALNRLYGASDAYITTTLGEGHGCSITEALAARLPVVGPVNTSLPELVGSRGYLYPCRENIYLDAAGYRQIGREDDVLGAMKACYEERGSNRQFELLNQSRAFVESHSWEHEGEKWRTLLEKVDEERLMQIQKFTHSAQDMSQKIIQGEYL